MDKLVEKIAKIIFKELITAFGFSTYNEGQWGRLTDKEKQTYISIAEAILSDPSIVEIDPDAELPGVPYYDLALKQDESHWDAFRLAMKYVRSAGWVKKK